MPVYFVATAGSDTTGDGSAGNPWATPGKGVASMAGGDTLWVQSGTYAITSTLSPPAGTAAARTAVKGYRVTPGDLDGDATFANHPILSSSTASLFAFTIANNFVTVANFAVALNGASGSRGIHVNSGISYAHLLNCRVSGFGAYGYVVRGAARVVGCAAQSGASGATAGFYADEVSTFLACRSSANACPGFYQAAQGPAFVRCLSYDNTGGSGDGFLATGSTGLVALHCVARGNGRDGFRLDQASDADSPLLVNCVAANNAGYGLRSAATSLAVSACDYNAFYSNGLGPRSGVPAGAHDVLLTADPFADGANGNFGPNAAAGGGSALRGAGYPGAFPGGLTTGYPDLGAAQHRDAGGASPAGGLLLARGMTGGYSS